MRCSCGSEANDQVLTPEGPHYGKVVCQVCRKFLSWMPYPNKPVDPAKLPKHPPGDPLPKLTGRSPAQVDFGARCRDMMLVRMKAKLTPEMYDAALTIADAIFWIANKDRLPAQMRWPHEWS